MQVQMLIDGLREQVEEAAAGLVWDVHDWIEAARPPANLHGTNPTSAAAAQGLTAAGASCTSALVALLAATSSTWLLRVHVLDALGLQGADAMASLKASVTLAEALLLQLSDEVRIFISIFDARYLF
jgi:hypothetical protein